MVASLDGLEDSGLGMLEVILGYYRFMWGYYGVISGYYRAIGYIGIL